MSWHFHLCFNCFTQAEDRTMSAELMKTRGRERWETCSVPCLKVTALVRDHNTTSHSALGSAGSLLFGVKYKLNGSSVEQSYTFALVTVSFRAGEERCEYSLLYRVFPT